MMAHRIPLLVPTPFHNPLLWGVGWTSDSLLMNRIQQKMMECHFHNEVTKNCDFHLARILSVAGILSLAHLLAHSDEQPSGNSLLPTTMRMSLEADPCQSRTEITAARM